MAKLDIHKLKCIDHSSEWGDDDCYLMASVDGESYKRIWGGSDGTTIDEGSTKTIDKSIEFNTNVILELYDHDSMSSDDPLGSATYGPEMNPRAGTSILRNSQEKDQYELTYTVN